MLASGEKWTDDELAALDRISRRMDAQRARSSDENLVSEEEILMISNYRNRDVATDRFEDLFLFSGGVGISRRNSLDEAMAAQKRYDDGASTVVAAAAAAAAEAKKRFAGYRDAPDTPASEEEHSSHADARTCSICLEDIGNPHRARVLSCMHVFHDACVSEWLARNPLCPLCRTPQ